VIYQDVDSFRHETSASRDGILDCEQDTIRDGRGSNELTAGRINQSCYIGVRSTVASGLDDFSKSTSCCRRDVNNLSRRGKLKN
jgi:hypothetical protein